MKFAYPRRVPLVFFGMAAVVFFRVILKQLSMPIDWPGLFAGAFLAILFLATALYFFLYSFRIDGDGIAFGAFLQRRFTASDIVQIMILPAKIVRVARIDFNRNRRIYILAWIAGFDELVALLEAKSR